MRKGQLEFVVILGIIVVVVVVSLYALQTGVIQDVSVSPDVRLVRDATNNFIRSAAYDTLRKVSENGGYLEPQAGGVVHTGKALPYWLKNGQVSIPDVRAGITAGITDYINENKDNFSSSISGKPVSLGRPQVNVNVLENQLSITVNMPTTVGGATVPQPYSVMLPTKIGEVIEFSDSFARQQAQNRYIEYFIISSMLMSPYDGFSQTVPTHIFLTGCGEFVFKSWFDVKPHMEETIRSTLAHTYMPDKYPMGSAARAGASDVAGNLDRMIGSASSIIEGGIGSEGRLTQLEIQEREIAGYSYPSWETGSTFLKYAIPELSGKRHFDLNVSFDVEDGFSLSRASMQMRPDPVVAFSEVIPMAGICMSEGVNVLYNLRFPVVVKVRDTLTGNVFRFAVEARISDNKPVRGAAAGYESDPQSIICRDFGCMASIVVSDSEGRPADGASATYMGCDLGQTGADGTLYANVPCGSGPLNVYKKGYEIFSADMNSSGIANARATIRGTPVINAHLYEAVVSTMGAFLQNGSSYMIPAAGVGIENLPGVNPMNSFSQRPTIAYLNFLDPATGENYDRVFSSRVGTISGIPSGSYMVSGSLASPAMTEFYGGFAALLNITESMDGTDIYIYLPYSYEYGMLADRSQKISGGLLLSNLLSGCGLGPITSREYNGTLPCVRGIDDI